MSRRTTRTTRIQAAALLALLVVTGCTPDEKGEGGSPGPDAKAGSALAAVDSLTVKGRAPRTGYERERFGSAWADTDSNGCGTRVISMLRQVARAFVQFRKGALGCAY
ncbi:hypothetical protein ACFWY6_09150 [Streptomyces sp. NPDC059037]|uniref:hypothetical protein n=1 Tax=Streptomyces sp. NPDC059037 TaxID=3346710 RepID=UPI0036749279